MDILIKDVIVNDHATDILIENNIIAKISDNIDAEDVKIINGKNKLALPAFYNTHTHAGMTLMRGYSDDLPVLQWLEEKIWPLEAHLTAEDVYYGTKLACLEMIKTGTVFFNDMYWHFDAVAKAVEEMGLRAAINSVVIDFGNSKNFESQKPRIQEEYKKSITLSNRIQHAIGTHAIYTVSKNTLKWCADFAREKGIKLHIHISETEQEVRDCIKSHGCRPVEYLEKIGFWGPNVIAAHSIWLNEKEINILKQHKVIISHIPTSNMKLSSGVFAFKKFQDYEERITLGTDGCASNNNLDMGEEMKIASCKAKLDSMDPTIMDAGTSFRIATQNGARAFDIDAGVIKEGKLADLILVDLNNSLMVPAHHHISNFVYSANSSVIDTTICDGKILMENKQVSNEMQILQEATAAATNLINRKKD
jgi:5-methylthioadenosine/S-adenosylhomocysteine deaminase